MSGYIGPSPVPQSIQRRQTFTATAAQTTFGTTGYTDGDFIDVYLNGVKLVGGTDYTATNGTDVVLTTGAAAGDILDFVTFNSFQLNAPSFDNSLTLQNATEEDTDGGRESTIIFKGEQSGGEISTLAEIEASHDGTADDEKGDLIFRTNDGADGSAPTERLRIDSGGRFGFAATPSTSSTVKIQNINDTTHNTLDLFNDNGNRNFTFQQDATGNAKLILQKNDGTNAVRLDANLGGILFGTDNTAANTLDDYEEGTFTASLDAASLTGHYTKVGNLCYFTIWGTDTNDSANSITGLPFTSGGFNYAGVLNFGRSRGVDWYDANGVPCRAYVHNSSTTITFRTNAISADDASFTITTNAVSDWAISGVYQTT